MGRRVVLSCRKVAAYRADEGLARCRVGGWGDGDVAGAAVCDAREDEEEEGLQFLAVSCPDTEDALPPFCRAVAPSLSAVDGAPAEAWACADIGRVVPSSQVPQWIHRLQTRHDADADADVGVETCGHWQLERSSDQNAHKAVRVRARLEILQQQHGGQGESAHLWTTRRLRRKLLGLPVRKGWAVRVEWEPPGTRKRAWAPEWAFVHILDVDVPRSGSMSRLQPTAIVGARTTLVFSQGTAHDDDMDAPSLLETPQPRRQPLSPPPSSTTARSSSSATAVGTHARTLTASALKHLGTPTQRAAATTTTAAVGTEAATPRSTSSTTGASTPFSFQSLVSTSTPGSRPQRTPGGRRITTPPTMAPKVPSTTTATWRSQARRWHGEHWQRLAQTRLPRLREQLEGMEMQHVRTLAAAVLLPTLLRNAQGASSNGSLDGAKPSVSTALPDAHLGFLLSGPPGVGKTFAMRRLLQLADDSMPATLWSVDAAGPTGADDVPMRRTTHACQYKAMLPAHTASAGAAASADSGPREDGGSRGVAGNVVAGGVDVLAHPPGQTYEVRERVAKLCGRDPSVVRGTVRAIATAFVEAMLFVRGHPERLAMVYFDEVDAICPASAAASPMVGGSASDAALAKLVLFRCLDTVSGLASPHSGRICVLASTNHVGAVDPTLRQGGRLDLEIAVAPPTETERLLVLRSLLSERSVTVVEAELQRLARVTAGYVAADLAAVLRHALDTRTASGVDPVDVVPTTDDAGITARLESAVEAVGPSCLRGGDHLAVVRPKHRVGTDTDAEADADGEAAATKAAEGGWRAVVGHDSAKRSLIQAIEWPTKHAAAMARMGVRPAAGVLLYGPPGCAKTSLVRAATQACTVPMLVLSGADVYSPYTGDAEAHIRTVFQLARNAAPCVLFVDEIDAMVSRRGLGSGSGGCGTSAESRVLSTFLNEMDGVAGLSEGVVVVGATNRPWALDDALLRKGRFDSAVHVPLPSQAERVAMLHTFWGKHMSSSLPEVEYEALAEMTAGFSGADLRSVCREALMLTVRRAFESLPDGGAGRGERDAEAAETEVGFLRTACEMARPSVSPELVARCTAWATTGNRDPSASTSSSSSSSSSSPSASIRPDKIEADGGLPWTMARSESKSFSFGVG